METVTPDRYQVSDDLRALLVPIDRVQPFPGNYRRGDVEMVRASLRRFGQRKPIVAQVSTRYVAAGNHVWKAAKAEGWTHLAVTWADLDDTEAKAFAIADNRSQERGGQDDAALAAWLQDLNVANALDGIGYDSADLDRFLTNLATASHADEAPELPEPRDTYVTPGQLYACGPHRVLCGDATDPAAYARLMEDGIAGLVWTDPPYGVEYVGKTKEALTIEGDARDEASLADLLTASLTLALGYARPGAAVYVASPGGDQATTFQGVLKGMGVYRQTIIWVKDVFVLGHSDYHWRHEPLLVAEAQPDEKPKRRLKGSSPVHYGWKPGAAHYFVPDRTLDTVWEIPRPKRSTAHPTMKPVELVERSITASSKRGDLVLDPFAGSGTTLVAADRTGRAARVMDLDPRYVQVILERYREVCGGQAVLL